MSITHDPRTGRKAPKATVTAGMLPSPQADTRKVQEHSREEMGAALSSSHVTLLSPTAFTSSNQVA